MNQFLHLSPYIVLPTTILYTIYDHNAFYITLGSIIIGISNKILKNTLKIKRPGQSIEVSSSYGMPSVHCAYLFGLSNLIYYLGNQNVAIVTFILSCFVAKQRLDDMYHTFAQVFAGIASGYIMSICYVTILSMYSFINV